MSDLAIIHGDLAMFQPNFGAALVTVPPGGMSATGTMTIMGKKVCLEGDEKKVSVPGTYIKPPYVIPGMGTVTIKKLAGDQLTKKSLNGKKMILKGKMYDTEFTVSAPAMQPTPTGPVPDGGPKYNGKGQFVSTNVKCFPT